MTRQQLFELDPALFLSYHPERLALFAGDLTAGNRVT
jgi:hypothetical protein